jgi:hypothetical protein
MLSPTKPSEKRCKACGESYIPKMPLQRVCSIPCSLEFTIRQKREKSAKALRASDRSRRRELRTKSDWIKLVQTQFNAFIRLRDSDLPCVSCGTTNPQHTGRGGAWDCGHYLARGSHPELRFVESNAAKQCKKCNSFRSGDTINFRKELLKRLGADPVAWLEGPHKPKQYSIDELEALERHYKAKIKELRA